MLQQPEPEMETEPKTELEPETDVIPTPYREPQRGVETPPPRTSSEFYNVFPDVLNGAVRRATLQGIVDVLKVNPEELIHKLANLGASPVLPTDDDVLQRCGSKIGTRRRCCWRASAPR